MTRAALLCWAAPFLFLKAMGSCELVDLETAKRVLGAEIIDTTTDPASFCLFLSTTTAAQFSVRKDTDAVYDQITIPQPFTPVDIGERARYHRYPKGGVAVQFVSGESSVTLAVRILRDDGRDYLELLLDIAREIAAKLD